MMTRSVYMSISTTPTRRSFVGSALGAVAASAAQMDELSFVSAQIALCDGWQGLARLTFDGRSELRAAQWMAARQPARGNGGERRPNQYGARTGVELARRTRNTHKNTLSP